MAGDIVVKDSFEELVSEAFDDEERREQLVAARATSLDLKRKLEAIAGSSVAGRLYLKVKPKTFEVSNLIKYVFLEYCVDGNLSELRSLIDDNPSSLLSRYIAWHKQQEPILRLERLEQNQDRQTKALEDIKEILIQGFGISDMHRGLETRLLPAQSTVDNQPRRMPLAGKLIIGLLVAGVGILAYVGHGMYKSNKQLEDQAIISGYHNKILYLDQEELFRAEIDDIIDDEGHMRFSSDILAKLKDRQNREQNEYLNKTFKDPKYESLRKQIALLEPTSESFGDDLDAYLEGFNVPEELLDELRPIAIGFNSENSEFRARLAKERRLADLKARIEARGWNIIKLRTRKENDISWYRAAADAVEGFPFGKEQEMIAYINDNLAPLDDGKLRLSDSFATEPEGMTQLARDIREAFPYDIDEARRLGLIR